VTCSFAAFPVCSKKTKEKRKTIDTKRQSWKGIEE
jgi:hypothetical protein